MHTSNSLLYQKEGFEQDLKCFTLASYKLSWVWSCILPNLKLLKTFALASFYSNFRTCEIKILQQNGSEKRGPV